MIFKNKKGAKYLSIWWFFIIFLSAAGIVASVSIFYSAEVNVKYAESEILYQNLLGCLDNNGFLNSNISNSDFDIFKECNLSEKIFDSNGEFYFRISFFDKNNKKVFPDIRKGYFPFEEDCLISKKIDSKNYPSCSFNNNSLSYLSNNKISNIRMEIITASNQKGGIGKI